MLEHLFELFVGNYEGDFVTKTENQKVRDNQQERFLIEKNPQRLNAKRIKNSKIQSEHSSDVVRSAEMSGPILKKEFVT